MFSSAVVSLPIKERARAHAFYRDGLGLEAVGPLAEDGLPEPLQFVVNAGLRLMLVPRGGFGWVVGGREVAAGPVECLLSIGVPTESEVDSLVDRAAQAGAEVVSAPAQQPWGYVGTVADPDGHLWMVTAGPLPS